MIQAHGIDIIEIKRIERAVRKWGQKFLRKIFTPLEQKYCRLKKIGGPASLAARFAAKEAVLKVLSRREASGIRWTEIEIYHDRNGSPAVRLRGRVKEAFAQDRLHLSLSHSDKYAVASVIRESRP